VGEEEGRLRWSAVGGSGQGLGKDLRFSFVILDLLGWSAIITTSLLAPDEVAFTNFNGVGCRFCWSQLLLASNSVAMMRFVVWKYLSPCFYSFLSLHLRETSL